MRPFPRLARALAVAAAAAALSTCGDAPTGPLRPGDIARIRVVPVWPSAVATGTRFGADVDNVRLVLTRAGGAVAADTTIPFPALADSIVIEARVVVERTAESFDAVLQLRDGTAVLYEGQVQVTASSSTGGGSTAPEIPLSYVGIGATAQQVQVSAPAPTAPSRATVALTAVARDAQNAVVPSRFHWTVTPASMGSIDTSGVFTGAAIVGQVTITATTPGGVSGSTTIDLLPTMQSLEPVSGNAQSAAVTTAFGAPMVVRALDGTTPVPGVIVSWTVQTGRGTLSALADTTDANGLASVSVTADTLAGLLAVDAAAEGFTVGFSHNVLAGAATSMLILDGNAQTAVAGTALPVSPAVQLRDQYANPVAGVAVTFAVTSGGGSIGGSAEQFTNSTGAAAVPTWTLGLTPGAQTLSATSGALSASFTATATAPATMAFVALSGDNQIGQEGQPLAQPFVARLTNNATPVVGQPIVFSVVSGGGTVSDDTVMTNANGEAAVTYTLGIGAVHLVRASFGTLTVDFDATSAPAGFTHVWLGTTDNWSVGTNWSGGAVPTSTDNTYIPSGTPNAPRLTAASNTAALLSEDTRPINVGNFVLAVHGNLESVGGWTTGTGRVELRGAGATWRGVAGKTFVTAATALADVVVVTDTLQLTTSGALTVGMHGLVVSGPLITSGSGRLLMNDPAGVVDVTGNAFFNGGDLTETDLTAGQLVLRGNFATGGCCFDNFKANGSHSTYFAGSAPQSLGFTFPGETNSRFAHLVVTNPAGVTVSSDVYVSGDAVVAAGASVAQSGARTLFVGGVLSTAAGTHIGTSAIGIYAGAGAAFPLLDGSYSGTLRLLAGTTILLGRSDSVPAALSIESNTLLDLNGFTLDVNGSLSTTGGGGLRMQDPAGLLIVEGAASFNGDDYADGDLSEGVIEFRGNVNAGGCCFRSLVTTGNHLTRFNGTAPQTIALTFPGATNSRFQQVEMNNPAGIVLTTDVYVTGNLDVLGGTPVSESGSRTLWTGGQLASEPGTSITVTTLGIFTGTGPTFPLLDGTWSSALRVQGVDSLVLSRSDSLPATLLLESNTLLDLGPHSLVVGADFATASGSALRMTDAAGVLRVHGAASFNGRDYLPTDLTAGLMDFKGNFSAGGCCFDAFRAAGEHRVRFSGTSAQSLSFTFPGASNSLFNDLEITNPAGVVLNTDAFVFRAASLQGTATLGQSGTRTFWVGGPLTSDAGTSITVATIGIFDGDSAQFPLLDGARSSALRLLSSNLIPLPRSDSLPSNLSLETDAVLDIGPHTLRLLGSLTTSGGYVRMTDPAGVLAISGSATFNGHDFAGTEITAGRLEIGGNFVGGGCCFSAFVATGTHRTVFNGTSPQTIGLTFPGSTNTRFHRLELDNPAGIVLSTDLFSHDSIIVRAGTTVSESGTRTLWAGGVLTTEPSSQITVSTVSVYAGAGAALPDINGTWTSQLRLTSGGTLTPSEPLSVPGNLLLESSTVLLLGTQSVSVGGSFTTAGTSLLRMNDSLATLTVAGTATFNGAEYQTTDLTAGTLSIGGDFSAGGSAFRSFVATGTHLTRFTGAGAQSINFVFPGATNSRFLNLQNLNTSAAGLSFTSPATVMGFLAQQGRMTVPSPHGVAVSGQLSLGSGSITDVLGTLTFGSCLNLGALSFTGFSCP